MPVTIVVSDTSPLNYLLLCGAADILPQLFGKVTVPGAVLAELRSEDAPSIVRAWTEALSGPVAAQERCLGRHGQVQGPRLGEGWSSSHTVWR